MKIIDERQRQKKQWWICSFNKVRFNVFYVIIKNVPINTNFKQLIYQTKLTSYENDIKLF